MKTLRLALLFLAALSAVRAQVISVGPQNQAVPPGASAVFTVAATGSNLTYQWARNGNAIPSATSAMFTVNNVQPDTAGIYTVTVTSGSTSVSASAILGLTSTSKVIGAGTEVGANIVHQNGNVYDQVLLTGAAATVTADPGQIVRTSYIDVNNDIVQVEFSGAGALTIGLDSPTGPAPADNYNQPTVSYMKGHATIVIAGANETTNVSIFSVGSITAVNQALFKSGVPYDGMADLACLAILTTNGKFGGIRTANATFYAGKGLTGVFAPNVQVTGPAYVGEINAFSTAQPVLVFGSTADARITGGDLFQQNGSTISVGGITQLNFAAGSTSHGAVLPAQINLGHLVQNGTDVTSQIAGSGPAVVSVTASRPTADESGANNGEFTFTRTGSTIAPLTVFYGVGGSAVNNFDYVYLPGTITFPAFARTVTLPVLPNPDLVTEGTDSVVVTLTSGTGYSIGTASSGTVQISDSPATLYVANLRPAGGATASTASGVATILLSASGTLAGINVSFSNLSSAEVTAHLTVGANDEYVVNLPNGQVSGVQWVFAPTATYTTAQLLTALQNGGISVRIDSSRFPAGELRGNFIVGVGSQTFTAPAAPPAISLTNVTATDAARFLTQATFGPKQSEIDALTGGSISAWLDTQLAMSFTSHRTAVLNDQATFGGSPSSTNWNAIYPSNRQAAWFKTVLTAPDQLRQRVAFALSEIFVVSDVSLGNDNQTEPLAHYYDILGAGAFGNFRTLLENVTLHPMMGNYLSSLRNSKADPTTGTTPDENYAREVMQLFTIGLNMLQPDGTLQLGADALPIATYDQTTITEMAKVFTGWSYSGTTSFRSGGGSVASMTNPMILFPANHDDTIKHIVNGVTIPASQGGATDLRITLDTLFNHPNTGPFIARQLIQRLVTSNPSPAYVYRVAEKFRDNGAGVRGDMAAVVRAILTDYEARSPDVTSNITYGKLKEPLLRLTGVLRAFNAAAPNGRYLGLQVTSGGTAINGTTALPNPTSLIATTNSATNLSNVFPSLAEAPLRSPTVFNFFHANYVLPGALAAAGLVAPEYEITDDTYAIDVPNLLRTYALATVTSSTSAAVANVTITLDLTSEQAMLSNTSALIDHLNMVLCGGSMPAATKSRIVSALAAMPTTATALERAQSAVLLVATSPAGATQK